MCRAVPARVLRVDGDQAWVAVERSERAISTAACPGVQVGDYVYHHAGMAMERLDPTEAEEVLALLAEIDDLGLDAESLSP